MVIFWTLLTSDSLLSSGRCLTYTSELNDGFTQDIFHLKCFIIKSKMVNTKSLNFHAWFDILSLYNWSLVVPCWPFIPSWCSQFCNTSHPNQNINWWKQLFTQCQLRSLTRAAFIYTYYINNSMPEHFLPAN